MKPCIPALCVKVIYDTGTQCLTPSTTATAKVYSVGPVCVILRGSGTN